MKPYDPAKIEQKWQRVWDKKKIYQAKKAPKQKKFYGLIEFPYPSGDGLHVGHPRPYLGMDVIARKRRMEGYNVLFPIGWDAFGLPTENYAIKTGVHPKIVTKKNTDNFRRQIKLLGTSFDWSREVDTTDPKYYKWTQWIFLQLYKNGLAYKKKTLINWCPKDKIGLANEEVIAGCCERCGTPVEKREKAQWMLAITKYADRLDKDLDTVDYVEKIKIQQRNWIGKSEGAEITFSVKNSKETIQVFTTRPDTLFGVTYVVLAPEHELVQKLKGSVSNWNEVEEYVQKTSKKDEMSRTAEDKEKTGVELKGILAINPAHKESVPVFIADYVLANYGTGAVMAVPAHDERDYAFAKKYKLPIKEVISGGNINEKAYTENGVLVNSGKFDGKDSEMVKKEITEAAGGKMVTTYKLRDWVFSRQRYWGEPIPMISCEKCGWVPVPEKDLPVKLPEVKNYVPTDSGESPLAAIEKWVKTKCPTCKGPARRETDTMPNWAGSSWYYLRYTDPKNKKTFASSEALKYWTPVDWYNGGMEHTTLHLLYSRFWHKFLYDIKQVPTSEPYMKRTSHGLILAEGGEKMSKSKGNVVNPDSIVEKYGADTLRLYEMFMGPFDQAVAWSTDGIVGPRRFIEKVWRLQEKVATKKQETELAGAADLERSLHILIKKITEDIESMSFNTAVSSLMIFATEMDKQEIVRRSTYETFLQLLAPFAPHVAEELWALTNKKTIHLSPWPIYDPAKMVSSEMTIVIQINGKVRAELVVASGATQETIQKAALAHKDIHKWVGEKKIIKVIYVKGKLINIVAP